MDELDYTDLYRTYARKGRKPGTEPATMAKIAVYAYSQGIYSTREIERACRYDLRFHYMICKMSGNMVYGIIMNAFEDSSFPLIELFYHDPEVYGFVLEQHRKIACAIEAHRVTEAETQMRLLLEHGETILKKLLQRRS